MGKNPAFQFYTKDWLTDPNLRSCSLKARGLMIDLMCLMHQSEKYGYLILNGKQIDQKVGAKLIQSPPGTWSASYTELINKGVLRYDNEVKAYFSKRMVEDEKIRTYERERKRDQRTCPGDVPNLSQKCPQGVSRPSSSPSPNLHLPNVSKNIVLGENPRARGEVGMERIPKFIRQGGKHDPVVVSYAGELLWKLRRTNDALPPVEHPNIADHIHVSKYVPSELMYLGLQSTQDAVILAETNGGRPVNPDKYFAVTVRRIAEEQGIFIPRAKKT